jgi:hypothetical protein
LDSAIRGTAAITAIRIILTRTQLRTTIPIIRTRITPIRMRTGLRPSSTLHSNNSMALPRRTVPRSSNSTVLRRTDRSNSSNTLLRRTVHRNSSTVKGHRLRRPRSKPRRSRTRLRAIQRHRLRNPAPTPARMASGTVSAKSLPSKTARLACSVPKGALLYPANFLLVS